MKTKNKDSFLQKRFQRKNDYIHRNVAGSDVLISVGQNIANFNGYIQLNESALFLWDMLANPQHMDKLINDFAEKYELLPEEAQEAVCDFVSELLEEDMVEVL